MRNSILFWLTKLGLNRLCCWPGGTQRSTGQKNYTKPLFLITLFFVFFFLFHEIAISEEVQNKPAPEKESLSISKEKTTGEKKQETCCDELNAFLSEQNLGDNPVRIAAIYRQIIEEEFCKGILEAVRRHAKGRQVDIKLLPYASDNAGVRRLKNILSEDHTGEDEQNKVDIIIGPTDSSVFVRARDNYTEWIKDRAKKIPIISPLVTGAGTSDPKGWFFQLNVNVDRRAQEMAFFIGKHFFRSIAILYADTTFGQKSEEAFRKKFTELRPDTEYLPLQYNTSSQIFDPSSQVLQVIKSRSDAVGIFGSRDDILVINKLLKKTNPSITPYNPLLFTTLDALKITQNIDELYMLSVVDNSSAATDENVESQSYPALWLDDVQALTHDTTLLVLDALDSQQSFSIEQADAFREKISDVLEGALEPTSKHNSKTNIAFRNFENTAKLHIYLTGKDMIQPVLVEKNPSFSDKLSMKFSLLYRVFSYWPYLNIFFIFIIVVFFTYIDLRRWYRGPRAEMFNFYSIMLILINIGIAFFLFIYLSETGKINYNSVITAMIIGMTPATLLRSTLFETKTGKSIGLANIYDKLLIWINDKLRIKKYKYRQAVINVIAYFNCLDNMIDKLFQLYDNAKDAQRKESLKKELKEELEGTKHFIAKKRLCAEKLLTQLGWKTLRNLGYAADKEFKTDKPIDPDIMIAISRDHINAQLDLKRSEVENKLDEHMKKELENLSSATDSGESALNYDRLIKEECEASQKNTFTKICFLVRYFRYTSNRLIALNFLPEGWKKEAEKDFKKSDKHPESEITASLEGNGKT